MADYFLDSSALGIAIDRSEAVIRLKPLRTAYCWITDRRAPRRRSPSKNPGAFEGSWGFSRVQ
jgi:hypothetical protein